MNAGRAPCRVQGLEAEEALALQQAGGAVRPDAEQAGASNGAREAAPSGAQASGVQSHSLADDDTHSEDEEEEQEEEEQPHPTPSAQSLPSRPQPQPLRGAKSHIPNSPPTAQQQQQQQRSLPTRHSTPAAHQAAPPASKAAAAPPRAQWGARLPAVALQPTAGLPSKRDGSLNLFSAASAAVAGAPPLRQQPGLSGHGRGAGGRASASVPLQRAGVGGAQGGAGVEVRGGGEGRTEGAASGGAAAGGKAGRRARWGVGMPDGAAGRGTEDRVGDEEEEEDGAEGAGPAVQQQAGRKEAAAEEEEEEHAAISSVVEVRPA